MRTVLTAKAIDLMNGWTVVVIEPMLAWIEKVIGSMSAWTEKATVSKPDMIERRSEHGKTATKP
jgi:hypothetical protein